MSHSETEVVQQLTSADGVRLQVWRTGTGTPVVLLHGFPEDHRSWKWQVAPLAEAGFSALAPDLRGYGASDKPTGVKQYRLQTLVGDVASIARTVGPPIHLVGHDWGGVIAWAFASSHPELLRRLVILNAPHPRLFLRAMWRSSQLFKSWYAFFFQLPWLPERALAADDFRLLRKMYLFGTAQHGAFTAEEIEGYVAA